MPELGFAGKDSHAIIGAYVNPRSNVMWDALFFRISPLPTGFLPGSRIHCIHHQAGAEQLEQIAAIYGETVLQTIRRLLQKFVIETHREPPAPSAARRMAAIMREYVPQRQIFPFMPRMTSSSLGFGFAASKPTADMIIPGVQYEH